MSATILFAQILSFLRTGEISEVDEKVVGAQKGLKLTKEETEFCLDRLLGLPLKVKKGELILPAIVISMDKVFPKKRKGKLNWATYCLENEMINRTNEFMAKLIEEDPQEEAVILQKAWQRCSFSNAEKSTTNTESISSIWENQEPDHVLPSKFVGLWSSYDSMWAPRPDEVELVPYDWSHIPSTVFEDSDYESCRSTLTSSAFESANQSFSQL